MKNKKIVLNDDQIKAVQKLIKWYYIESYQKNYFALGGLAGTGKSFLVSYIINKLDIQPHEVIFACFTGKAALRLRIAGNNANTIHSTFYRVLQRGDGTVAFYRRKNLSDIYKLIVIDEAGMVGMDMMQDILAFNVPTILLGDPGQLKPILRKENQYMKEENLDVFLTIPMRFSDTSGILDLASLAREGKGIPYGSYKKSEVVHYRDIRNDLHKFDQVICFKHRTRKKLNVKIRKQLGYDNYIYPVKGEKIICLKNNYNHSLNYNNLSIYLINGLIGIMLEDGVIDKQTGLLRVKFRPDFIDEKDLYFDLLCHPEYFSTHYYDVELPDMFPSHSKKKANDESTAFLTYAYTIGLHKYQGSEADNVCCIIDDFPPSHPDYKRFIYTGITRAKERITVATFK